MKNLIGKKVRGFKFYGETDQCGYDLDMDEYINHIGIIEEKHYSKNMYRVHFSDNWWWYPASLIEQHLVDDTEQDNVNSPSHYTKGGIECIDAIEASMTREAFLGYLKGNVQKYIFRYESKSKPVEDLKKAQWYLNKLISKLEGEND